MNAKKFSDAMSELDSKYIDEALNYKKKSKKPVWVKWGAMAACFCLVLSCVLLYEAENRYPVRVLPNSTDTSGEIAELPRWEDMEIYQQYDEITLNDIEYHANRGEISVEQLGTKISDVIARGWDEYAEIAGKDAERYCRATVYEIQSISTQCAVAVQYEGTSTYYAAVNSSYRPETLGQFIEDLDLQNNLIVNWASYDYHKPISGFVSIRFEQLDTNKVWDLLLSNTAAINEYDNLDFEMPKEILDICVSVPLLGYENISISIREEGYIITNILSTGKMFRVGEENTKAFVDYVLDECDGYEIVYSSNPSDSIPE